MQYVEVCELLAGAEERYYIMKQLAICFVTSAMNMVESFLSEAQQHPGVPCEALKFLANNQLPSLKKWCLFCVHQFCQESPSIRIEFLLGQSLNIINQSINQSIMLEYIHCRHERIMRLCDHYWQHQP